MQESPTISTQNPIDPAMDYNALRAAGIQWLEQTASSIWTDYNVHDPGITTLELLCYVLTDLSYRCSYSIPDLLATETDTANNIQKQFYSAKQIFPNRAVTINDYRKLLINIEGVKNAWIQKTAKQIFADITNKHLSHQQPLSRKWEPVVLNGYYNVLLEFDTNVAEGDKNGIIKEAKTLLMVNRNLCEDFLNIDEISSEPFILCAEIEIDAAADPFDTLASIFFNVQLFLTPLIKFYRLAELFAENYTSDKIFEGPWLSGGFIKDEDLLASDLKSEIHLSDIMGQIMQVQAVSNILSILFNPKGLTDELPDKWIIDVMDGKQPQVDILSSNVLFYINGIPFRPDMNKVKDRFTVLMSDFITGNDSVIAEDIIYDTGQFRNIENYYSVQNHYPQNYGISHWGLPGDAGNERLAQAKQLQGYLFFFDQQLANFQSQLAHLRNVFSFQSETQTYFTQLVSSFKDAQDLFISASDISNHIQQAAEQPQSDAFFQRRNLFLDHLLARFAESFGDYVNVLQNAFPDGTVVDKQKVVDTKSGFLQNYPDYSSQRFLAYDYTGANLWTTGAVTGTNISGLEKRLEHLLGFTNVNRRSLVNIYSSIKNQLVSNTPQFWFEVTDNQNGNILLRTDGVLPGIQETQNILDNALTLATNMANFVFTENTTDHSFTYQLKNATTVVAGVSNTSYATKALALADVSRLVSLLTTGQSDEGLFLVEHPLLLPESVDQPPESPIASPIEPPANDTGFMPICVDENCDECDTLDPYSFRISMVLPAYAPRFLNMDFRRYCERVIRMEMPSHIYTKICWVSNEQLRDFENAYQNWLDVKAGLTDDADHSILKTFVNILTTLKTVYPTAKLEDCSSEEEIKLFLLNQNALGTLKT